MKPGDRLGAYTLLEEIGFGGMGVVYRARDERLHREVAVKVLAPWLTAEPAAHDALLHEARLASSLNHPNVCTVHEVGDHDGRIFIVMELIRGGTLGSITAAGPLPVQRAVRYALQIADALAEAHARGVIHRDLKINNVMVTETGLVKVLDFGIAIRHDPHAQGDDAQETAEGTLAYMAPEQLDRGRSGVRTDLWSLGVLLYEMCTGERPFHGQDVAALEEAIRHGEPAPLPSRVGALLRGVIQRCLEKDPALRYGSASEVRAALEIAQHDTGRVPSPVDAPAAAAGPARRAGLGRRAPVLIAIAALAIAAFAGTWFWRSSGRQVRGPQREIRSIAVLPLDNVSGDPAQDYFADGMTEELIAMLGRVTPLQVISRTSVMRYRNTDKSLREIARELRVDAVVEGTVLRSGDRVRVTAQLVDAAADRHLWSRSYEREVEDVLALQMEIANEVVGELHAVLLAPGPGRMPQRVDPETWDAMMRGRFHLARRTVASLEKALEQYQSAIERSPSDAGAWAGLASAHALLHSFGAGEGIEHLRRAEQAADRAIGLDPDSPDAQTAHGQVSFMLWQWGDAERSFQHALGVQPAHTEAHFWYSQLLLEQGRMDESLTQIDLAVRGDPLSQICSSARAEVLSALGRYQEASDEIDRTVRLDPTFGRIYLEKLDLMHIHGQLAEAAYAIGVMDSLNGMSTGHSRQLLAALAQGGPRGYWSEASRQLLAGEGDRVAPAWWTAYCLTQAGRHDEAFEWLARSLDRHEYPGLAWRWSWAPLRGDPRFTALLQRMGLGGRAA